MNTYFEDIEYHLLSNLNDAKERILIAVAWLTNERIASKLSEKKDLDIDIIVDENPINRNSKAITILQQNNINVSFIKNLTSKYYIMHNKFCVIDNLIVLTGSYNWTHNANNNEENLARLIDKDTAIQFNLEFSRIKNFNSTKEEYFFPKIEEDIIINTIVKEISQLIKENQNNLEENLIFNWTNKKLENRIRVLVKD